ncbi:MAG: PAS domain S-box protein [Desulfobacterales bacterium]|nr:PAS domain S-box protein [Desulfobacterales bacterium]
MNATHVKKENQGAKTSLRGRLTQLEKLCEHQKQTIAELLESKKRHRAVLDNIEEGYFEVDLAGNMLFFNDSLCRITGYTRETLMGVNNREYTTPETSERMYKVFNSIYRTGNPVDITDYEIIKRDGTRCFLELSTSLILNTAMQPIGFRGVARDVSERKQAIETLRKSEEKFKKLYDESKRSEELYRSLLQSSADAIVICGLDAKTIYISPAFTRIFGWKLNELVGKPLPFISATDVDVTHAAIQQIIETGKSVQNLATRTTTKHQCFVDINISGSRYNDHESRPAGILLIIRDTSAQKKLEDQLLHSQKMEAIGTLAGGIAHDFNNLLMGIQGRTSLILMNGDTSPRAYEHLKGIEDYVKNAADLTRQILGFARGGKYEVKTINLNELISKSANMFGRTKKEINIETKFQADVWTVEVDPGQIEQALLNMYVNAWQAMPGGGTLSLETKNLTLDDAFTAPYQVKSGEYVMVSVTDTGEGIDKNIQKRIFDPFFTTKEVGRGTGLGLSSTYGIIQNHNGIIEVNSIKGEGTTFNIYLPASDSSIVRENQTMGSILMGNETILLVDDEEMIVEIGEEILEKLGYTVLSARSGQESIEIYQKNKEAINLIILDMIMPGMSGKETYEALKGLNSGVKILLSSGYSMKDQTTRILENGCDGFIQKPFSIKDLSRKLREILDQKGECE